jgi:hypothetical protein
MLRAEATAEVTAEVTADVTAQLSLAKPNRAPPDAA